MAACQRIPVEDLVPTETLRRAMAFDLDSCVYESTVRGLPSAEPGQLPVATEVSQRVLCPPIHPKLDEPNLEVVNGAIRTAAGIRP